MEVGGKLQALAVFLKEITPVPKGSWVDSKSGVEGFGGVEVLNVHEMF